MRAYIYSVLSDCIFKGVGEDQDGIIRWWGGRSEVVGVVGLVSSVPCSSSRLRTWGRLCTLPICRGNFLYIFVSPDEGFQEEGC